MKLVFFGSPDFALPTLNALNESPHDVLGVVTSPDQKSGRGLKIQSSSVKKMAEKFGIPISLVVSRIFDILAIFALVMVGVVYGMGFYYYLACGIGTIVLFLKHLDILYFELKRLRSTFVFGNIGFSFAIFAGVITELLIF
mgnify:CR=1 FL=1